MTANLKMVQDASKSSVLFYGLSHTVTPDIDSLASLKIMHLERSPMTLVAILTGDSRIKFIAWVEISYFRCRRTWELIKQKKLLHTENFILVDRTDHQRKFIWLNSASVDPLKLRDIKYA